MILFRGEGPGLFAEALEEARRNPASERQWYLSVIGTMAGSGVVETCEIAGLEWCEVDFPADLTGARALVAGWE
ncbi:MAG: hypothetical protein IIB66_12090 [Proteobacteria bacterium]|nr:hypothetical protein [Pseudomonadota bacterium]